MKKTLRELAEWVDGQVCGDGSVEIDGITGIDEAGPSDVTFAVSPHLDRAAASKAAAVIIPVTVETLPSRRFESIILGWLLPVC